VAGRDCQRRFFFVLFADAGFYAGSALQIVFIALGAWGW
jgi:hypothetical protein